MRTVELETRNDSTIWLVYEREGKQIWGMGVAYSPPIGSEYRNAMFYDNLYSQLLEFSSLVGDIPTIIIGDFNARIGDLDNTIVQDDELAVTLSVGITDRKSSDKTITGDGRKLVAFCEESGFLALNGRTNGDLEGNFTFIGNRRDNADQESVSSTARVLGKSVIDYALISVEHLHHISDFRVGHEVQSQHQPLEVHLTLGLEQEDSCSEDECWLTVPKYKFNEEKVNRVEKELEKATAIFNEKWNKMSEEGSGSIETYSDCFSQLIKRAFAPLKLRGEVVNITEHFDDQILSYRNKAEQALLIYRECNTEENLARFVTLRAQYYDAKREEEKRTQERREKNIALILAERDWKQLWQKVGKAMGKKGKFETGGIKGEEWRKYFDRLYNIESVEVKPEWSDYSGCIPNECLDGEISKREIQKALSRMKNNKAHGMDNG